MERQNKSLGKPAYVVVDGNLPAFSFHTMGETCMVSVPVPFFFRPPNIVARFFPVWTTSSPRTATVSVSQAAGLSRAPCVSLLIVDLGRGEAVQTTDEGSLPAIRAGLRVVGTPRKVVSVSVPLYWMCALAACALLAGLPVCVIARRGSASFSSRPRRGFSSPFILRG